MSNIINLKDYKDRKTKFFLTPGGFAPITVSDQRETILQQREEIMKQREIIEQLFDKED